MGASLDLKKKSVLLNFYARYFTYFIDNPRSLGHVTCNVRRTDPTPSLVAERWTLRKLTSLGRALFSIPVVREMLFLVQRKFERRYNINNGSKKK